MAVRLLDFGPKLGYLKDVRPLGGILFKMFSYCSQVFVQRLYCCYVNTVNTNSTVESYR